MAKTIEDAVALFASGKSPRECEKLTGIPKTTVDRAVKKRGIKKGKLGQLIADKVRVDAEMGALSDPEKAVVTREVAKHMEGMEFYSTTARKVVDIGVKAYKADPSAMGMKTVLDGMKSGMQVEGVVPFYPTPSTTNNSVVVGITHEAALDALR